MKKYAAIIVGLTAIILLTQTNLFNDLLFFFLVGAIPGTTKSVPSYVMLSVIVVASWIVIFSLPFVRSQSLQLFNSVVAALTDAKAQLAKRRLNDV